MIVATNAKNRLVFGGDPVPVTASGSLSTSRITAVQGIVGQLLARLIQSPAAFQMNQRND